ncbi:MAG: competence/damage-inducible protein A [Rhodobacteraceae bacterium]|nr:competence/damage-inducible protein A [Paracoccaceae bacterium]|tara:strand:- start:1526 stop:2248 length:723 start_codon:yes stop_codon:yes gene_type:complete
MNPTAAMLVIGDEILSGRTRDANMYHLAGRLTEMGINLKEVRVVADEPSAIIHAVNELRSKFDHVFTSGGIGPTHDDITAENVAAALGVPIAPRQDAIDILATNYANGYADLNTARMRMTRIPDDAKLIDNSISKAPGFTIANIHVMAGVPKIFKVMLDSLLPKLKGGDPVISKNVKLSIAEGDIAEQLKLIVDTFPTLSIGSYPFSNSEGYGTNVVIRGTQPALVTEATDMVCEIFNVA